MLILISFNVPHWVIPDGSSRPCGRPHSFVEPVNIVLIQVRYVAVRMIIWGGSFLRLTLVDLRMFPEHENEGLSVSADIPTLD